MINERERAELGQTSAFIYWKQGPDLAGQWEVGTAPAPAGTITATP
jgi:hypothetical protein